MASKQSELLSAFCKVNDEYATSGHALHMQQLLKGHTWTINRIVIIGLGENWYQLSMIKHVASHLEKITGNTIEILNQELITRPAYNNMLQTLGIKTFTSSWGQPGPIVEFITEKTMVFAPFCHSWVTALVLRGRDPEIYLGTCLGTILKGSRSHLCEVEMRRGLEGDIKGFLGRRVGRRVLGLGYGGDLGGFRNMGFYWRGEGDFGRIEQDSECGVTVDASVGMLKTNWTTATDNVSELDISTKVISLSSNISSKKDSFNAPILVDLTSTSTAPPRIDIPGPAPTVSKRKAPYDLDLVDSDALLFKRRKRWCAGGK